MYSELELLVGCEESHEDWGNFNTDGSLLVDVVVSPGSWEVFGKVILEGSSGEFLVGGKNFSGGSSGGGFSEGEYTGWLSIFGLSFSSIVGDHGSHEKIIGSSGELLWNFSFVFLIEWSGTNISGIEEISMGLDETFIIGVG